MANKKIKQSSIPHQEPKQDSAEQQVVSFFEGKVLPYWRKALWLVVMIVLVAVIAFRYAESRRALEAAGYTRLDGAATVDELREVASDYAGHVIEAMALMRQASLLLQEEDYHEAHAVYQRVAEDFPASRFYQAARLGRAYSLEMAGEYLEARNAFQVIVTDARDPEALAAAWCGFGRNSLALNETEDAQRAFERALALVDEGPYANQARQFISDIKIDARPLTISE